MINFLGGQFEIQVWFLPSWIPLQPCIFHSNFMFVIDCMILVCSTKTPSCLLNIISWSIYFFTWMSIFLRATDGHLFKPISRTLFSRSRRMSVSKCSAAEYPSLIHTDSPFELKSKFCFVDKQKLDDYNHVFECQVKAYTCANLQSLLFYRKIMEQMYDQFSLRCFQLSAKIE